jgi:hypothetical protein
MLLLSRSSTSPLHESSPSTGQRTGTKKNKRIIGLAIIIIMWISSAVFLFVFSLFFLFSLPLASRFSPLSRSLLLFLAPLNRPIPSICSLSPGRVQRWNRGQSSSYPTPTRSTSAACATAAISYGLGISL